GSEIAGRDFQKVAPRGAGERFHARRLRPVGRVRWHALGLFADKFTPHAAYETKTIAADSLERGLVPIRRADPASRFRDDRFSTNDHGSALPARAIIARLTRKRIADDKIVAGNVRKAAKIHHIVEAVVAGLEPLVTAGHHREGIPRRDRLRHRLPELEGDGGRLAVAFYLDAQAGIGAACEGELSRPKPTVIEAFEPACS